MSNFTQKQKQKRNRTRHDFLLTLFPNNPELFYMVKKMNGFSLVRQRSSSGLWEVAIYREKDFIKREVFLRDKEAYNERQAVTQLSIGK